MRKVSVIIPHYRQMPLLRKCLQAVQAQSWQEEMEIIVADNDSPGDLAAIIDDFPDVTFVVVKEKGAACARNGALRLATGDIIAFTDSDCVPAADWLESGIQKLDEDDTDIVGGAVHIFAENEQNLMDVEAFEKVFGFRQEMYINSKKFSVTANIITSRDVVEKTGSFTNGLSEDVDWCHRAQALGFRLSFYSKCIVSHPARRDWSALQQKWRRLISERWKGYRQAQRNIFFAHVYWYLAALVTAVSAIPHVLLVLRCQGLKRAQFRWAALKVLFRIRFWRCVNMMKVALTEFRSVEVLGRTKADQADKTIQEV